ncbi:hypothetical protein DER46DRAFT_651399 [Fusarium sp. MPI-SDFR-AT-0072]|nr:hypothetical protein DER46DRAFT_651399 [Fusarium sp. MPI-SDFR-AT-0072]
MLRFEITLVLLLMFVYKFLDSAHYREPSVRTPSLDVSIPVPQTNNGAQDIAICPAKQPPGLLDVPASPSWNMTPYSMESSREAIYQHWTSSKQCSRQSEVYSLHKRRHHTSGYNMLLSTLSLSNKTPSHHFTITDRR